MHLCSHSSRQQRSVLSVGSIVLLTVAVPASWPSPVSAAESHWQVGATPGLSSGKYGTDTRTEIVYTPLIARRLFDQGDVTLVFPFICITGNGGVTVISGSPVRTDRLSGGSGSLDATAGRPSSGGRSGGADAELSPDRGNSRSVNPRTGAPARPATNCGLGDAVVRGRYYVVDERGWIPTLGIRAHLKVPTADQAQGLGTGRPDEGIGVEISRTLGRGFVAMVDGGYTIIGRPEGADFRNSWWSDVGVGQDLAHGVVNVSVFFERYRAIVPGLTDAREVTAAVTLKGRSGWRIQLSGQIGLSDGAPDHGITVGASRRF